MSKFEFISNLLSCIFEYCKDSYVISNEEKIAIYIMINEADDQVDIGDVVFTLKIIEEALNRAPKNLIEFKNEY